MPYENVSEIPEFVKEKTQSERLLRMWYHVWNAVFKKTGREMDAFKAANARLKEQLNKELFKKMTRVSGKIDGREKNG